MSAAETMDISKISRLSHTDRRQTSDVFNDVNKYVSVIQQHFDMDALFAEEQKVRRHKTSLVSISSSFTNNFCIECTE